MTDGDNPVEQATDGGAAPAGARPAGPAGTAGPGGPAGPGGAGFPPGGDNPARSGAPDDLGGTGDAGGAADVADAADATSLDDGAVGAEVAAADELAAADEAATEDPMTALALERDDYRDALIRLQADFENYKKRMIKQQTDHLERAAGTLVEKLLPVLDTADLALAHGGGEDVKQIAGSLSTVLEREGLERIDPVGVPFDPTLHDAVAHEPGDGGQEVVEVLRAGYRWKGKVLRPALVKVRG